MSAVLPLQTTCVICIVRHLLDVNDKHLRYRKPAEHLKKCILSNSCNVTALELLLKYVTKHYPRAVTSQMLEFLVPLHLKTLDLSKCTAALQLEEQYASLLPRLSRVKSLIHTEGLLTDPLPVSLAFDWSSKLRHLTSVVLEECPGVTDKFVSVILFNVPNITHLNLARCSQITDAAFLNTAEHSPPKLASLDVSGCDSLTSTAIRLLTELCGPSLRHLNVALTNMDCTILWYLAGHSLASSVQLASEVRGKINNLADAISSQMDRLIHEFQFITEKLKQMGARNEQKMEDGENQIDAVEEMAEDDSRDGGESNAEGKDDTQGVMNDTIGKINCSDASRSLLRQESLSERPEQCAEALPLHESPCGASDLLHQDGMNEYLEQQTAAADSEGVPEDVKGVTESGLETSKQDKFVADAKSNFKPLSKDDSSLSHQDEGEAATTTVTKSDTQSDCVGEVTDKSSTRDMVDTGSEDHLKMQNVHHMDKDVNLSHNTAAGSETLAKRTDKEMVGNSPGVVELLESVSTDQDVDQNTGEQSKGVSLGLSPSEENQTELEEAVSEVEKKDKEEEVKVDPCSHCLHNSSKAHIPKKLFQPHILSLTMDHIEFHADLIKSCFDEFFSANSCLQTITISNRSMTDELLQVVANNCPDLRFLRLLDCAQISSQGLAYLLEQCKHLKSLFLRGVPFLSNSAFCPLLDSEAALETLHIAEVRITDGILHRLSKVIGHSLKELNLNWCEDITSQGILSMAENCPILESFAVRQFQVNEGTLRSLSVNCPKMKYLDLSGVEEMTDTLMAEMMPGFRMLEVLDVSWTLNLTDSAVKAILSSCPLLRDLNLAGLKRITEKPFLPIISDVNRWKRCQALIKLKLREQKVRESTGQDIMSSDEEYEDLYVPVRSTSYAPLLQRMDLQFCDLVKDNVLEEIVAVCCGSLEIIDYYGLEVCPKLLKL